MDNVFSPPRAVQHWRSRADSPLFHEQNAQPCQASRSYPRSSQESNPGPSSSKSPTVGDLDRAIADLESAAARVSSLSSVDVTIGSGSEAAKDPETERIDGQASVRQTNEDPLSSSVHRMDAPPAKPLGLWADHGNQISPPWADHRNQISPPWADHRNQISPPPPPFSFGPVPGAYQLNPLQHSIIMELHHELAELQCYAAVTTKQAVEKETECESLKQKTFLLQEQLAAQAENPEQAQLEELKTPPLSRKQEAWRKELMHELQRLTTKQSEMENVPESVLSQALSMCSEGERCELLYLLIEGIDGDLTDAELWEASVSLRKTVAQELL